MKRPSIKKYIILLCLINLALAVFIVFHSPKVEKTHIKIQFLKDYYIKSREKYKTIILGDSTVAFGVNPEKIKDSISLALPGATMLTTFIELTKYNNIVDKPKCVVLSTAYIEEYYDLYLWNTYIPTGLYRSDTIANIYELSEGKNIYPSDRYSAFHYFVKSKFYQLAYQARLIKFELRKFLGLSTERSDFFEQTLTEINKSNGYVEPIPYNTDSLISNRTLYLFQDFSPVASEDLYFKEILDYTTKKNIKLFYIEMPILPQKDLKVAAFHSRHIERIQSIISPYSNAELIRIPTIEDPKLYNDISHLNKKGADIYSSLLADALRDKCE